jgi:hypothetical protein
MKEVDYIVNLDFQKLFELFLLNFYIYYHKFFLGLLILFQGDLFLFLIILQLVYSDFHIYVHEKLYSVTIILLLIAFEQVYEVALQIKLHHVAIIALHHLI